METVSMRKMLKEDVSSFHALKPEQQVSRSSILKNQFHSKLMGNKENERIEEHNFLLWIMSIDTCRTYS